MSIIKIAKRLLFRPGNRGVTLVMVGLFMLVFLGFAGMAVDLAYVYFIKNHLQVAADAAALAGAATLYNPGDRAQLAARAESEKFAGKNNVALAVEKSTSPELLNALGSGNDIAVGFWNSVSGGFTPGAAPVNAIKVRARRTGDSPGGPVNLFFARAVGWTSMSVSAEAVAFRPLAGPSPIAVNEYWYGDNPSQFKKDNPRRLYPHSYFRQYNVDGTPSNNWVFGSDPLGSDHGMPLCIAGENANPNNSMQDKGGYVALDFRVDSYLESPAETWYANPDFRFGGVKVQDYKFGKGDWAPYLDYYPYTPPVNITEKPLPASKYPPVFKEASPGGGGGKKSTELLAAGGPAAGGKGQGGKGKGGEVSCPYDVPPPKDATSPSPYATVAYMSGVSTGLTISDMIGNDYRGGRYAPGKEIIVLVYDGLGQGSGNRKRITVVGYAKVRIIGYGVSIGDAVADPTDKTGHSVYAYAVEPMRECHTAAECTDLMEKWVFRQGVLVR